MPSTGERAVPKAISPPTSPIEEGDDGADISDALAPPSDRAVNKRELSEPVSKGIDHSTRVEPALPEMDPDDMDVESLQKRLKLVEQRFAGMFLRFSVELY
jgi:hypothetical protein